MTSYCEVFQRKEKKYRLSAHQYQQMLNALCGHMELDAFGETKITSLYYDTPERSLIARSIEKPLYKEKLRVRRYGGDAPGGARDTRASEEAVGSASDTRASENAAGDHNVCASESAPCERDERVFIEIKKKYKGIVYKRRVCCSSSAARAYLAGMPYEQACSAYPLSDPVQARESISSRSMQISHEIDQFCERYDDLEPSVLITCMRSAYKPLDASEGELRITFDADLAYYDCFALDECEKAKHASTERAQGNLVAKAPAHVAPAQDARAQHARAQDTRAQDARAQDTRAQKTSAQDARAQHASSQKECALLPADEVIMEIKNSGPVPLWLSHALTSAHIYPTSFSKYGTAYRVLMNKERTTTHV